MMAIRPPAIAEDTLKYILYPGPGFHDKSSVTTLVTVIHVHVSSVLPNHIWHRDSFELKVVNAPHNLEQWIIEGHMRVGDCVDDEWCVVWLLRDISTRWDVAVSVFDSDGEFLLIEAAHHLPAWVTPKNSQNRVWIYEGRLHLVPLQHVSAPKTQRERRRNLSGLDIDDEGVEDTEREDDYISMFDAIEVVRDTGVDTLALPAVESAAMRRTEGYPQLAPQHLHRTTVHLPRDIVIALSNNPALVQKATEAFYTRDAFQLRAATRMARFPPSSSVLSTVTMTRAAYAQLIGQKFHPPKVFGQWKEREGTRERRWKDLGMKIACGFEMLYQESKGHHKVVVGRMDDGSEALFEARKDALSRDPEYTAYIRKLQEIGYFGSETQGSTTWKEQENRAAIQFIDSKTDDANRPSFAYLVNLAISQGDSKISQLTHMDEDSEEWLNVDERTVEDMLLTSARAKPSGVTHGENMDVDESAERLVSENEIATEQAGQLRNLAEKVEKFVEGQGGVEGAMFEDDIISGDEMSQPSDSDDESTSNPQDDRVESASAAADRQAAMDRLVPAIEPSEYGKMPPGFHSNSQKVKDVAAELSLGREFSEQNADPPPKPTRPLIFPRDQFDGVEDSDDENEENDFGGDGEEDEEDQPTVLGEVEIDMQQEAEDFLEFSREALGITPSMWNDIVQERKGRGAFLPASALREESRSIRHDIVNSSSHSGVSTDNSQNPFDSAEHSGANLKLNSFEAVMQAMDAELSRAKRDKQAASGKTVPTNLPSRQQKESKGNGKEKAREDDEDEDVETAMDIELRAALRDASDDDNQEDAEAPIDYTLIRNFLDSFKGQHGLSGPVSNLVGRLQPGWKLPRDET